MSDIQSDAAPMAWPVANAVAEGTPAPEAVAQVALQQELSGNVAAAVEGGAPVTGDAVAAGGDLPRESHLMLLKAKLAALEAKIGTGALIVKAEFAEILAHIEAVL